MRPDYEVSRYRPADRDQVLRLQKLLWSTDLRLNEAYFRWKYEENPWLREIPVYLARSGGDVIGMRGFHGNRWEAGHPPREFLFWIADDLVVEPEHRNQGVVSRIMKTALADLAARHEGFTVNLSGSRPTVLGSLTMGWRSAIRFEPVGRRSARMRTRRRLWASVDRLRFFWRLGRLRWFDPRGLPEEFVRLDERARRAPPGRVRLERSPDPVAMAALIHSLGYDGRIRHVRDAVYFDWRFRNPFREYRFLCAGESRLTGYLVLRRSVSHPDTPISINLSDWEAETPELGAALLRAALSWGDFSELVAWSAALPSWAPPVLAEAGFVPVEPELRARGLPGALVRPLRDGVPEAQWVVNGKSLLDPTCWDLRMLYTMRG